MTLVAVISLNNALLLSIFLDDGNNKPYCIFLRIIDFSIKK